MKEGAGRLSSVLCSGFSYISVSIHRAHQILKLIQNHSNLKEACLLVSIWNVSCTFGPSSLTKLSMGAVSSSVVNHGMNTDKEGALRSQVSTKESHHIFNFSSAVVVTVVATKITVVSDEHQNCLSGGKEIRNTERLAGKWTLEPPYVNPKEHHYCCPLW